MTINTTSTNNPQRTEPFFDRLNEVLQNNDVETATTVARRIKALAIPLVEFPIPEACDPNCENAITTDIKRAGARHAEVDQRPIQIPRFHQNMIDRLEKDATMAGAAMRKELAPAYFIKYHPTRLEWHSQAEIAAKSHFALAFYYHATSLPNLEAILKTNKIKAQQSLFFGAFVGISNWHPQYGNCILALNKSIERHSPIATLPSLYEAGFAQDIPVNAETLNHIVILDALWNKIHPSPPESLRKRVEAECKKWSGRDIAVLFETEASAHIKQRWHMGLGTPKEWEFNYWERIPSSNPSPSRSDFLPGRL